MSDQVRNPEDRFSHNEAQIIMKFTEQVLPFPSVFSIRFILFHNNKNEIFHMVACHEYFVKGGCDIKATKLC